MLPAAFHDFGGIRKELCDKAIEPHFKVLCDAEKQEGKIEQVHSQGEAALPSACLIQYRARQTEGQIHRPQ